LSNSRDFSIIRTPDSKEIPAYSFLLIRQAIHRMQALLKQIA
jgi:hypothetical protein